MKKTIALISVLAGMAAVFTGCSVNIQVEPEEISQVLSNPAVSELADKVAENIDGVNVVSVNINDVVRAGANLSTYREVLDNLDDVHSVADGIDEVKIVGSDLRNESVDDVMDYGLIGEPLDQISVGGNIVAVKNDLANLDIVATHMLAVTTVAPKVNDVTTVALRVGDVETVALNIGAVIAADENARTAASAATSATESKGIAKIWSEGTDAEVQALGGTHSAKGWASTFEGGQSDWDTTDPAELSFIKNTQPVKDAVAKVEAMTSPIGDDYVLDYGSIS